MHYSYNVKAPENIHRKFLYNRLLHSILPTRYTKNGAISHGIGSRYSVPLSGGVELVLTWGEIGSSKRTAKRGRDEMLAPKYGEHIKLRISESTLALAIIVQTVYSFKCESVTVPFCRVYVPSPAATTRRPNGYIYPPRLEKVKVVVFFCFCFLKLKLVWRDFGMYII